MTVDEVRTVAVLGLGTMGHGIAQTFATAGHVVRCFDGDAGVRASALDRIAGNLRRMTEAGVGCSTAIDGVLQRIDIVNSEQAAVETADFVTEAVVEDLEVKRALFARVERMVGTETILASNSSSFPMTAIAVGMRRGERGILTHWFNPPHIVPVVEVVPGERTAESVVHATMALLERVGKTPVRLRQEVPGFLVNRVQMAMYREVWDLLERGVASAEDIDRAIRGSMGFRLAAIGPLEVNDFAGLDVVGRVYETLMPEMRRDTTLPQHIAALLAEGRTGVKAGRGIYEYTAEEIARKQARRDRLYLALVKLMDQDGGVIPGND